MIDRYQFGNMVIDGRSYDKDLILTPSGVHMPWIRERGHRLQWADLSPVHESPKGDLVVGTGKFGMMRIGHDVLRRLRKEGWTVHAATTEKAVKIYNRLVLIKDPVAGAFHLTC